MRRVARKQRRRVARKQRSPPTPNARLVPVEIGDGLELLYTNILNGLAAFSCADCLQERTFSLLDPCPKASKGYVLR